MISRSILPPDIIAFKRLSTTAQLICNQNNWQICLQHSARFVSRQLSHYTAIMSTGRLCTVEWNLLVRLFHTEMIKGEDQLYALLNNVLSSPGWLWKTTAFIFGHILCALCHQSKLTFTLSEGLICRQWLVYSISCQRRTRTMGCLICTMLDTDVTPSAIN